LHISDFFIMGERYFDEDTSTHKAETMQISIKKEEVFASSLV